MSNNLSKNIFTAFLISGFLVLGMYLVFKKTDLFPSASRSRSELRGENRSIKQESALTTTPAIETKANLSATLKDLDSMSPDSVGKDLQQNDSDSNNF